MVKAYFDSVQKLLKENNIYRVLVLILLGLTLVIFSITWIKVRPGLVSVPLIYSSLRGVIYLVDWYQFYLISALAIFNFFLTLKFVRILNERYRYFTYSYLVCMVLIQLFLLTSVSLLINNFNV